MVWKIYREVWKIGFELISAFQGKCQRTFWQHVSVRVWMGSFSPVCIELSSVSSSARSFRRLHHGDWTHAEAPDGCRLCWVSCMLWFLRKGFFFFVFWVWKWSCCWCKINVRPCLTIKHFHHHHHHFARFVRPEFEVTAEPLQIPCSQGNPSAFLPSSSRKSLQQLARPTVCPLI